MKRLISFLIYLLLASNFLFAQQDAQFSQYIFNQLYYNPAYAGIEDNPRFTFLSRTQWLGYSTTTGDPSANPNSQILSYASKLGNRSGIGGYILNDAFGSYSVAPLRDFQAQLSYAYHVKFGENILSIGLRAGIDFQYINTSNWRPPTDAVSQDPTLNQISQNGHQSNVDLGLGLWYKASKFFVGLSSDHLQQSNLKINVTGGSNNLTNHTYLTAGYIFRLNQNLNFRPTVLVKTDFNSYSIEPNAIFEYSNYKVWGGVSYRSGDAIIPMIGLSVLKDNSLRIGYSCDFTVINVLGKALTSQEIMLSYILPPSGSISKPVIKTPRFAF